MIVGMQPRGGGKNKIPLVSSHKKNYIDLVDKQEHKCRCIYQLITRRSQNIVISSAKPQPDQSIAR